LRGAKPADIPVEQLAKFDLVIKRTTANALGLKIPEAFMLRGRRDDRIISSLPYPQMRTSEPDTFAVGDAVEVKDFVTGRWNLVALAGSANRQAPLPRMPSRGATPASVARRERQSSVCLEARQHGPAPARRH
jgi:hypothetical protein